MRRQSDTIFDPAYSSNSGEKCVPSFSFSFPSTNSILNMIFVSQQAIAWCSFPNWWGFLSWHIHPVAWVLWKSTMLSSTHESYEGLNSVATLSLNPFVIYFIQKNLSLCTGAALSSSSNLRQLLILSNLFPLVALPRHDGFQNLSLNFRKNMSLGWHYGCTCTINLHPSHLKNSPNNISSCPLAFSSSLIASITHSFMHSWGRKFLQ